MRADHIIPIGGDKKVTCANNSAFTSDGLFLATVEVKYPPLEYINLTLEIGKKHHPIEAFFPLKYTDDPEITCISCERTGCDLELQVLGDGKRTWAGLHTKCLERHYERMDKK